MKVIVLKSPSEFCGDYNGYLLITEKDHPWYGMDYDDINDKYQLEVHGGLTFGEMFSQSDLMEILDDPEPEELGGYLIGFDTCHYGDASKGWTYDKVEEHTIKFLLKSAQECYKSKD
jgi:hypothetical protein